MAISILPRLLPSRDSVSGVQQNGLSLLTLLLLPLLRYASLVH